MRNRVLVALIAGLLAFVSDSRPAEAGATIDLIWRGDGDGTLDLTAGAVSSTITLDIFLKADEPIFLVSISLEFDGDGVNELNALSVFNWGGFKVAPGSIFGPLGVLGIETESGSGGPTGEIQSFSTAILSGSPPSPAPAGTYHIGTAVWHVTPNLATDGPDILSGLFNTNIDVVLDGTGLNISNLVLFRTASVNVPEPGTAALFGVGLLGVVLAARRQRS